MEKIEEKHFDYLQLHFENDNGEYFNGSLSVKSKVALDEYLNTLSSKDKQMFFLLFVKNKFLNNSFLEIGATLDDLKAILDWLEYNYF